jgi:hypothetical protein
MTIKDCYDKGIKLFKCRHTGALYEIVIYDEATNMFCYKNTRYLFTCDARYVVEPVVEYKDEVIDYV